jgi:hypothetical protein
MNFLSTVRSLSREHPTKATALLAKKCLVRAGAFIPYGQPSDLGRRFRLMKHELGPASEAFRDRVVSEAEEILQGKIECFGSFVFAGHIPWNTDFFSGKTWPPGRRATTYRPFTVPTPEDGKVPYELSRCQHFVPLAKAFALTGDARFIQKITGDLHDWHEHNPFLRSVNWTCAMDVGIRSVNWILAAEMCSAAHKGIEVFGDDFVRSLFRHGQFVWRHLEDYSPAYNTNHYLANLVSLLYVASCFPGQAIADKWFGFARDEFYKEARIQFLPDGPNYELSTSYHRLATEMLLSGIARIEEAGGDVPDDVKKRAVRAVDYVRYVLRSDGTVPQIGDNDDGRFHIFGRYIGWQRNDHRYLVPLGAAVLNQEMACEGCEGQNEEAVFFMGERGASSFSPPATMCSKGFPDAGMFIMRHTNDHVMVKVSNLGLYQTSGPHNHNDLLSFDLVLGGVPLIVDPGTGQYTGDIHQRNLFRSTSMHNTVMVDDVEQNEIGPEDDIGAVWSLGNDARGKMIAWTMGESFDRLVAEHTGYLRLPMPLIHRRTFELRHDFSFFRVEDVFQGAGKSGKHRLEWSLVLAPDVVADRVAPTQWVLRAGERNFDFRSSIIFEQVPCPYSPSYKRLVQTSRLRGLHDEPSHLFFFEIAEQPNGTRITGSKQGTVVA